VVRLDGAVNGSMKGIAATVDVTPRYCEADPLQGGRQAVAEAWRNLNAVGAEPLAVTDNLNFGNPEKPDIMGQFVACVKGVGEACVALDMPVVSGNVSLYNETNGEAILPTPAIGAVGLMPDVRAMATIALKMQGDVVALIGGAGTHLGQSIYLREILGREDGPPPPVDLAMERKTGELVRELVRSGLASAVHDISDGGLIVALAEMAMAGDLGASIAVPEGRATHGWLFGEDQARYLVTCAAGDLSKIEERARANGVELAAIGTVEGNNLAVSDLVELPVDKLRNTHERWLPDFMSGPEA
jgi:phosphoribosylformylglycinamidine synthase